MEYKLVSRDTGGVLRRLDLFAISDSRMIAMRLAECMVPGLMWQSPTYWSGLHTIELETRIRDALGPSGPTER